MIKYILTIFILFYFSLSIVLYVMQESLLFPGAYGMKQEIIDEKQILKNIDEISLTLQNKTKLIGAVTKHKSDTLLIYFGGNAENAVNFVQLMDNIKTVDTLTFNYRGYDKSDGIPSETMLNLDALEIYDTYKDKYI